MAGAMGDIAREPQQWQAGMREPLGWGWQHHQQQEQQQEWQRRQQYADEGRPRAAQPAQPLSARLQARRVARREAWLRGLWAAEASTVSADPWRTAPAAAAPSLQQLRLLGLADPSGYLLHLPAGGHGHAAAAAPGGSPWEAAAPAAASSARGPAAAAGSGGGEGGRGAARAAAVGALALDPPDLSDMATRYKQLLDNLEGVDI
jgi:hypothetical protein